MMDLPLKKNSLVFKCDLCPSLHPSSLPVLKMYTSSSGIFHTELFGAAGALSSVFTKWKIVPSLVTSINSQSFPENSMIKWKVCLLESFLNSHKKLITKLNLMYIINHVMYEKFKPVYWACLFIRRIREHNRLTLCSITVEDFWLEWHQVPCVLWLPKATLICQCWFFKHPRVAWKLN